ncbi:hypothetical protein HZY62_11825 [Maribacter polysiphoniae]|uniref:Uncharacterized protein n=1 Tax=Maribacter polysiphoniae TaxID=429344 RepID=A0A316E0H0_9FLAO|nr:hypothetical protein [Maribacter polysiphoniae]MBD1261282.1 hypothetical protein [Maribacter polysiphoniae]PWK23476.1 hypothetical protein LX92_02041 [Maribacter polysiphoniae]
MFLENTDLKRALNHARHKDSHVIDIHEELDKIFKASDDHDNRIGENLLKNGSKVTHQLNFDLLESEHIYHINHIKKICIDYRLRFLDSKYFKGTIPPEAISRIKHIEKAHQTELSGFKIIAPSKLFKLKDKDDPLLFVPLGNGYYYFIHKWGNDLHPLRKVLMWPFRNIVNLLVTIIILSYLTTLITPIGLFTKTSSGYEFWLLFFFMFKWAIAVVLFYGFAKGKNFNHAIWNSRYCNS